MNLIWRFFSDDSHRWKWQQLSASKEVIYESAQDYGNYEACMVDAKAKGYVFHASHARRVSSAPRRK